MKNFFNNLPVWKRNLYVLWFGTFMTGTALSEVTPFLSLYINEMGDFTKSQLNTYSSFAYMASFMVMAVVSPLWGKLADTKGRRLMLLRASIGMAIVFSLMSLATNVWEIIGLRLLQGAFGGFVSNANAFIAASAPKEESGRALGTLVTGVSSGNLLGPLLGGTLSTIFGYRLTFVLTGILLFLVVILVFFFVEETMQAPNTKLAKAKTKDVLSHLNNKRVIIGLFITTMVIQIVNQSINPIVALFVRELNHGASNTALMAGIVAAMPGIAVLIFAPRFGRLGDKIGTAYIVRIGFIAAFVFFIIAGFASSVLYLVVIRFMIGISDSSLMPGVNTLLSKNSPQEMTSRIFALNQSFQSIGSMLGPLLGSLVSNTFDYRGIFWFSAGIILLNFILFNLNERDLLKKKTA
jgi:DHA1 family multidrug resistance protein-like MFS transporter